MGQSSTPRYCKEVGCKKQQQRGGVCIAHGARLKKCAFPGCERFRKGNGVCMAHGAPPRQPQCSFPDCLNRAVKNGVCKSHGAVVGRCRAGGCSKYAQRSGLCIQHGAPMKRCSVQGCEKLAKRNNICISHGAPIQARKCAIGGCTKCARKGGLCALHGKEHGVQRCSTSGCRQWVVGIMRTPLCKVHSPNPSVSQSAQTNLTAEDNGVLLLPGFSLRRNFETAKGRNTQLELRQPGNVAKREIFKKNIRVSTPGQCSHLGCVNEAESGTLCAVHEHRSTKTVLV